MTTPKNSPRFPEKEMAKIILISQQETENPFDTVDKLINAYLKELNK